MRLTCLATLAIAAPATSAHASFTVIKGIDNWNAAVGPCTTLDFVFPPDGVYLTDQYASLGAIFPEGNEYAYLGPPGLFQQDGWGCSHTDQQVGGGIDIDFLSPQYAIAAWIVGDLRVDLYWQGTLIYSSPDLDTHPLTYSFGGVVSTQPFDHVRLWDMDGSANVDDVLFVPAPGAGMLIGAAGLALGRRRMATVTARRRGARRLPAGSGFAAVAADVLRVSGGREESRRRAGGRIAMKRVMRICSGIAAWALLTFVPSAFSQCPGDVDGDGVVGANDLAGLLGAWGPCAGCGADLDDDGVVGADSSHRASSAWR